jgi:ribose 5-phosphate isomerase B
MKIYIGADHRGFDYKDQIISYLTDLGHEVIDDGSESLAPKDDFPDYAKKVAKAVLADNSPDARGVLLCGSGQGMCMAANRFKGIRASICWDEDEAKASRHDDDANVLCLSADRLDMPTIQLLLDVWLNTPFGHEERYTRRIQELDNLS